MEEHYTNVLPEDTGSIVRFFNAFLDKATKLVQHLDTQINILIGISSAIFFFSASQVLQQNKPISWPLLVMTFFAGLSAFVALFAIHPPRFMRKKGQKESLLYSRSIASLPSYQEYTKELMALSQDKDAMIEQYSIEIYNLAKYYYRPKRKLFHVSRNLLIVGFILFMVSMGIHLIW